MTVIIIIALIILVISCITIYHNTNSFEPKQRCMYIVIGMLVMYLITTIICSIKSSGIKVENPKAISETLNVIKMIFTPINGMVILGTLRKSIWKSKRSGNKFRNSRKKIDYFTYSICISANL